MLKQIEKSVPELVEPAQEPQPLHARSGVDSAAHPLTVTSGRQAWLPLAGLLLAVLALNVVTLLRFPAPFVDEGWNASRSWALLHTGRAFGTLDAGIFDKYPGYWTYFPLLGCALHAISLAILGPSLEAMRLVSALFGVVLLAVVYAIGTRLYGYRAGLLSAILLSLSYPYLLASHLARHDIMVAVFGFGAIALYVTGARLSRGFPIASLLSGLLIGLTLDIHFNGMIYAPAVGVLYLLDYGWGFYRTRRFWGFVAGVALAVAYFVAIHILPYPQTYFTLASLGNGSSHNPPLLSTNPGVWLESLSGTASMLTTMLGLPLLVILAMAVVVLLRRRLAPDKASLLILAVLFLAFVSVIQSKAPHYAILIAPAVALVVGAYLQKLLADGWRSSIWSYARLILVTGLVVGSAASTLSVLTANPADDFQATLDKVHQVVPPGSTILGSQTYWFALPDERYLSWDQLLYHKRYAPGSTLEDAFRDLHSDYFVRDEWMDVFITDDPARLARTSSQPVLPKAELESFLSKRAHLVADIRTGTFGSVQVYKINWGGSAGVIREHPVTTAAAYGTHEAERGY